MPWYNNPDITCKVLNRIANRYRHAPLQDLNKTMDYATQLLWIKQERFSADRSSVARGVNGFSGGHQ